MKNKYFRKIRLGMFLCAGISSLFMASLAFADLKSECGIKTNTPCVMEPACQWNDSSKVCEVRTETRCKQIPTVHWEDGRCVKGFDPNANTTAGSYEQAAESGEEICDMQATREGCKGLSQCKWVCKKDVDYNICESVGQATISPGDNSDALYFYCKSRAFNIGEGKDEREADCNNKSVDECTISEMCEWSDDDIICHAKGSFMGIGTGKNKERRRLCNEAIEMLQLTSLTAGDQEMYEDQQSTYCSESAYVETYQGPVFAGPGLKAGAQMSGSYLDPSISKERSLPKLAAAWTRFLLQLSAVLAVIAFITAGVFYITDFGDGSRIELAKKIIIWTTVGILLIMGSYAIVNTLMKARFGDTDRGAVVGYHQLVDGKC